jgi:hypothetical protein
MPRKLKAELDLDVSKAESKINQLGQKASRAGSSGGGSAFSFQQANNRLNIPGLGSIGASGVGGLAIGASVAAIAAVSSELNKLGSRARELASTASNAGSQLGQLRSSIERSNISTDMNATSPSIVGFEKFKQDVGTSIGDFIAHAGNTPEERAKGVQEKLAGGLGQGNEAWRRLKEQGVDLETDIGIARRAQQVKWQRTERDFAQSRKEWEVQVGNQRFDLEKQASRQQFDNQIAVQKFQENFANKQSQKAYDLSRQFAVQSYQISQSRAIQDFGISQGDKRYDYNLSKSRNQQDFNLNKSYSQQDRSDTLTDMALGGASGLDYFRFNRDFNKQQARNQQQFQIGQSRGEQDFNLSNSRDMRGFTIGQQRAGQDFGISQQQAAASRQLELEAQEYARKYEGLELQTQINRSTDDLNTSFQRLNQQIGFQQTKFNNQASDMKYDKALDLSNFDLQTGRQRRNFGYATADFAGAARAKDPLGAAGLGSRDSAFADALGRNAQQSGQTDLFKQVNDSAAANSVAGQVGDIVKKIFVDPIAQSLDLKNQNFGSPFPWDWFKKLPDSKPDMSNPFDKSYQDELNGKGPGGAGTSINANVNVSGVGQDAIQKLVDAAIAKLGEEITQLMKQNYGG